MRRSTAQLDRSSSDDSSPAYDDFTTLAGPALEPEGPVRVRYRSLLSRYGGRGGASLIIVGDLVFGGFLVVWLLHPDHFPNPDHNPWITALRVTAVASILTVEFLRVVNVATLCLATVVARDPIPIPPEPGTRVAFCTTVVPSREPLEMVEGTLAAMTRVRHDGPLDVWLLDEGDDPDVRAACARLGVHHFTRHGVERWNQPRGTYKVKTKHGNYNAWIDAHGADYEFYVSVDPDHAPLPQFVERLLGYFRDPDIAFVVAPQVYGNQQSFVTRAAESQQFLFHGLLQRAGNAWRGPMLVGTNNAVRLCALATVGGLQDSVTEDMATSLVLHGTRNPATGRRWGSVYTPDILAVGEGPSTWTDYFTQQARWSRGTDEVLLRRFWRMGHRLRPGQFLHYALLMSYYPSAALAWVLGVLNGLLYLLLGVSGLTVAYGPWVVLYSNAAILQLALYFWSRRYNVSPHEDEGSSGLSGMFISMLSTPIYVASLAASCIGHRARSFVVTPKGEAASVDGLRTFRHHLPWVALMTVALVASVPLHHDRPQMQVWSAVTVVIAATPALIAAATRRRSRSRPTPPTALVVTPTGEVQL